MNVSSALYSDLILHPVHRFEPFPVNRFHKGWKMKTSSHCWWTECQLELRPKVLPFQLLVSILLLDSYKCVEFLSKPSVKILRAVWCGREGPRRISAMLVSDAFFFEPVRTKGLYVQTPTPKLALRQRLTLFVLRVWGRRIPCVTKGLCCCAKRVWDYSPLP